VEIVIPILFGLFALAHLFDVVRKAWRVYSHAPSVCAKQPMISVLVCAHNEATNLKELMPLLSAQHYPTYEVIVVLDRCTDESAEVIQSFLSKKIRVIAVPECPPDIQPKKNALTVGIAQATSEWVLLTDADCRPKATWIAEMANGMALDKEIVLGISPYQKRADILNMLIQYETFTTALYFVSQALNGKAYMGLGRNMAYRKATFERCGGFESFKVAIGGDDDLLVQQMASERNVSVIVTKEAHVDSVPKTDWRAYIRQKTRHFGVSTYYASAAKTHETLRWTIHGWMWLLFPFSLVMHWQLALVIFILTFLIKAISINIVADQLEKRFNLLWLPFVDVGYVVIFPLLSLRSFLVKRITWK